MLCTSDIKRMYRLTPEDIAELRKIALLPYQVCRNGYCPDHAIQAAAKANPRIEWATLVETDGRACPAWDRHLQVMEVLDTHDKHFAIYEAIEQAKQDMVRDARNARVRAARKAKKV